MSGWRSAFGLVAARVVQAAMHVDRAQVLDLSLPSAQTLLTGPVRAPIVKLMVEEWLNLAWKQFPAGHVSWGTKGWSFTRQSREPFSGSRG